ncbi:hypothetical protein [Streptomyces hawaiiensis]
MRWTRTSSNCATTVKEIAATCLFLCSEGTGYVTGQSVGVR